MTRDATGAATAATMRPGPALPRLIAVTDAASSATRGRGVVATIARMLDGVSGDDGAAVAVLVRAKGQPVDAAAAVCAALLPVVRRAGAILVVHTHVALVGALGLDGAHLDGRADAAAVRAARMRLPPGALLGVSRHIGDVDAAGALAVPGADYATLSPIFPPSSKPGDTRATLGIDALRGHALPVFALGGIDETRAAACVAAGAHGVAVLGGLMGAADPRRALRLLLDACGRAGPADAFHDTNAAVADDAPAGPPSTRRARRGTMGPGSARRAPGG